MKILLIDPAFFRWGFSSPYSVSSFGLICVGTYLKHKGHDVEILDMNAKNISYEELPRAIEQRKPDVVSVPSSMNCYVPESLKVVQIAKSVNPNIVTMGGGINFTLNSEMVMILCPELDFIVRGSGEYTALELIERLKSGKKDFSQIKSITYRENGKIVANPDRSPIMDLDSLPLPDWDLVNLDDYQVAHFPPSWGKQVLFTLSRGCPFKCKFCAPVKANQNTYQALSPERSLEEITILRRKYDRRMLWINDLIWGVKEDETVELLEGIIREKLNVNMCVDMRVDLLLKRGHLLPLMRKAGVRMIALGVESPSEKFHQKHEKYKGIKDLRGAFKETMRLLKSNKINTWSYHMFGDINDTLEDIAAVYKHADELDADLTIFAYTTPHPGTSFYEERKDYLKTNDLSILGEDGPVFDHPYLTDNQLRMLHFQMFVGYYAKPSRLVRKLIFGTEFSRYWTRYMGSNWESWASALVQMWKEKQKWLGFGTEEKKLKKWARDALGWSPWQKMFANISDTLKELHK